jgi:hypothetical protein
MFGIAPLKVILWHKANLIGVYCSYFVAGINKLAEILTKMTFMKIFYFFKNFNLKKNKNNEETSDKEIVDESSNKVITSELSEEELERNSYFELFQKLDKNIINQDVIELNGEGTRINVNGRLRYGHVKIKLSLSTKNKSEIIWNISEEEIPSVYRISVIKVANRFIDFFDYERKDFKKITFEIIGGSNHPIDSDFLGFEVATLNAIYNSFDKNLHQPSLGLIVKRKIKEPIKRKNFRAKK